MVKRHQTKQACLNCRKAHTACEENRPCERCVTHQLQDTCIDMPRLSKTKKRKNQAIEGVRKRRRRLQSSTSTVQRSAAIPALVAVQETNNGIPSPSDDLVDSSKQRKQESVARLQSWMGPTFNSDNTSPFNQPASPPPLSTGPVLVSDSSAEEQTDLWLSSGTDISVLSFTGLPIDDESDPLSVSDIPSGFVGTSTHDAFLSSMNPFQCGLDEADSSYVLNVDNLLL